MSERKSPYCPACGVPFAYDRETKTCRKCGLPDEVRYAGHEAIARWKHGRYARVSGRGTPSIEFRRPGTVSAKTRKRRKHGRNRG